MNNYIVSSTGENGIKSLGKGKKVGNKTYQYEIKIKGQYGDYRVYGNYDSKSEKIIFDHFGRH